MNNTYCTCTSTTSSTFKLAASTVCTLHVLQIQTTQSYIVSALCASAAGAYAVAHELEAGSSIHGKSSINADRFVN